jgi:hypothetical protein
MPKITQLNPITSISDDDLVPIVNDPSGAPSTNKITFDNFKKSIMKNIYVEAGFLKANTSSLTISSNTATTIETVVNTTAGEPTYAELYWNNVNNIPANNETIFSDLYVWTDGMGLDIAKYRKDLGYNEDYNWQWTKTGDFLIPPTGDIYRDGFSVINRPMLTPNIEYTGVLSEFPTILNISKGHAIIHTSNGHVMEDKTLYWLEDRFYTSDSDFTLTQTLNFVNFGGMNNNFIVGGEGENVLRTINLNSMVAIRGNLTITYLPALTSFNANNVVFVGGGITIRHMSKTNTVFDFYNLSHMDNNLIVDQNNTLTSFPQFPNLKIANDVEYTYNNSTTNYPIFTSLENCADITFVQNAGLPSGPRFPALKISHNVVFNNNVNMATPPVFTNLVTTHGRIEISECAALTSAPSFPALVTVEDDIIIRANPVMSSGFNFPALKRVDGDFIADNCAWTDTQVDYIINKLATLDGTNGTTIFQNRTVSLNGASASPRSPNSNVAYAKLIDRGCQVNLST